MRGSLMIGATVSLSGRASCGPAASAACASRRSARTPLSSSSSPSIQVAKRCVDPLRTVILTSNSCPSSHQHWRQMSGKSRSIAPRGMRGYSRVRWRAPPRCTLDPSSVPTPRARQTGQGRTASRAVTSTRSVRSSLPDLFRFDATIVPPPLGRLRRIRPIEQHYVESHIDIIMIRCAKCKCRCAIGSDCVIRSRAATECWGGRNGQRHYRGCRGRRGQGRWRRRQYSSRESSACGTAKATG